MDSESRSDSPADVDFSVIRTSIEMGHKMIDQILNGIHYGSEEVRGLLREECDFILECKVCRNLFRSFPNFVAHKRVYCPELAKEKAQREKETLVDIEEETLIIQPEDCQEAVTETNRSDANAKKQASVIDKVVNQTFDGKSKEYHFYTKVAEKVELKKASKVTNAITVTRIESNSNAVEIKHGRPGDVDANKKSGPKKNNQKNSSTQGISSNSSPKDASPKKKKTISDVCAGLVDKISEEHDNQSSSVNSNSAGKRAKPIRSRKSSPRKSVDSYTSFQEKQEPGDAASVSNTSKPGNKGLMRENLEETFQCKDVNESGTNKSWMRFCDMDQLKCKICNRKFSAIRCLKFHSKTKHGDGSMEYNCPKCEKSFQYITSTVRHLRTAHHMKKHTTNSLKKLLLKASAKNSATAKIVQSSTKSQDENSEKISGKCYPFRKGWKRCEICKKMCLKSKSFYKQCRQCRENQKLSPEKKTEGMKEDDISKSDASRDTDVSPGVLPQGSRKANNEDMLMKLKERLMPPMLTMTRKDATKDKNLQKSPYINQHASESHLVPSKPEGDRAQSILYKTLTENLNATDNISNVKKSSSTIKKETIVYVYPPSKSNSSASNLKPNKYVTLHADSAISSELATQNCSRPCSMDVIDKGKRSSRGNSIDRTNEKLAGRQHSPSKEAPRSASFEVNDKSKTASEQMDGQDTGYAQHGRQLRTVRDSPLNDNVCHSGHASNNEDSVQNAEKTIKVYETRHAVKSEVKLPDKNTKSYDELRKEEIAFKELEERLTAEAKGNAKGTRKEPDVHTSNQKDGKKKQTAISTDAERNKSSGEDKTPKKSRSHDGVTAQVYSMSYTSPSRIEYSNCYSSYEGSPWSPHSNSGDAYNSKFKMTVKEMAELVEGTSLMKFAKERKKKARKILTKKSGNQKSVNAVQKPMKKKVVVKKLYSTRLSTSSKTDEKEQSIGDTVPCGTRLSSRDRDRDHTSEQNIENLIDPGTTGSGGKRNASPSKIKIDTSKKPIKTDSVSGECQKNNADSDCIVNDTVQEKMVESKDHKNSTSTRASRSRSREAKISSRSSSNNSSTGRADNTNVQQAKLSDGSMSEKLVDNRRFLREMARLESSAGFLQSKHHSNLRSDGKEEKRASFENNVKADQGLSINNKSNDGSKIQERTSGLDPLLDFEKSNSAIKQPCNNKATAIKADDTNVKLSREQKRLSSSSGFVQSKHFSDVSSSRESSAERSRPAKRLSDALKVDDVSKVDDQKISPNIVKGQTAKLLAGSENTKKSIEQRAEVELETEENIVEKEEKKLKTTEIRIPANLKSSPVVNKVGQIQHNKVPADMKEASNENTENHSHRTRLATGSIFFDSELLKTSPSKFDKVEEPKHLNNKDQMKTNDKALSTVRKRLDLSLGSGKTSPFFKNKRKRTQSEPQRFSLATGVKQCQICSRKFWKAKSYALHLKSCRKSKPSAKKMSPSLKVQQKSNRSSEKGTVNDLAAGSNVQDMEHQSTNEGFKMSDSKKRVIDTDSRIENDTKKTRFSPDEDGKAKKQLNSDSSSVNKIQTCSSPCGPNIDSKEVLTKGKEQSEVSPDLGNHNTFVEEDNLLVKTLTYNSGEDIDDTEDENHSVTVKNPDAPKPGTSQEISDDNCSEFSGFSEDDIKDTNDDSKILDFSDTELDDYQNMENSTECVDEDWQESNINESSGTLDSKLPKDTQDNEAGSHSRKEEIKKDLPVEKTKNVKNRAYVIDCKNPSKLHCYNNSNVDKLIDEKNLKCRQCDTPCTSISNLRRHVIRHLGWKRYKCRKCTFTCYDMSECRMHLSRSHGEKLTGKNFSQLVCDLQKEATKKRSLKRMNTIRSKKARAKEEPDDTYRKPRPSISGRTSDAPEDNTLQKDVSNNQTDVSSDPQMFQGKHIYAQAGKSHGHVVEINKFSPRKSGVSQSQFNPLKGDETDTNVEETASTSKENSDEAINFLNKARLTLAKALNK